MLRLRHVAHNLTSHQALTMVSIRTTVLRRDSLGVAATRGQVTICACLRTPENRRARVCRAACAGIYMTTATGGVLDVACST